MPLLREDLRDVDEVAALVAGREQARAASRSRTRPGRSRTTCSGVMSGPPGLSVDVEALLLVVALLERRVVAGELRLRDPLQLQRDLVELRCSPWSRRRRRRVGASSSSPPQPATASAPRRAACEHEPDPSLHARPSFRSCPLVTVDPGQSASDDGASPSSAARRAPRRRRTRSRARSRRRSPPTRARTGRARPSSGSGTRAPPAS